MGFQDVAFQPSSASVSTTFLEAVVRGKQGMFPVRYFRSNKTSFLCQSNYMTIIRLLTNMR